MQLMAWEALAFALHASRQVLPNVRSSYGCQPRSTVLTSFECAICNGTFYPAPHRPRRINTAEAQPGQLKCAHRLTRCFQGIASAVHVKHITFYCVYFPSSDAQHRSFLIRPIRLDPEMNRMSVFVASLVLNNSYELRYT